ncbi:MAG: 4-Cys prefix domain-containing protein [Nostoc sp.]|uniref:4-Cys prefix domain-containing protein n=1 Tax=Nostoc sp. TaxID=1180 RepID=UPI002FF9FB04
MSLCINPNCQNPDNPDNLLRCQSCGSELLLEGRYRVTRLLSDQGGYGDIYEIRDRSGIAKVLKVLRGCLKSRESCKKALSVYAVNR